MVGVGLIHRAKCFCLVHLINYSHPDFYLILNGKMNADSKLFDTKPKIVKLVTKFDVAQHYST